MGRPPGNVFPNNLYARRWNRHLLYPEESAKCPSRSNIYQHIGSEQYCAEIQQQSCARRVAEDQLRAANWNCVPNNRQVRLSRGVGLFLWRREKYRIFPEPWRELS